MNEEIEVETIVLEDGLEYFIVDEIQSYIFLANVNNPEDVCIRKDVGEEITGLKDEQEVEYALSLYAKKYQE